MRAADADATPDGDLDRFDRAAERLEAALAAFERAGDLGGLAECHAGLGALARVHGRPDDALHHYDVALAVFRALGDRVNEGLVLVAAARVRRRQQAAGPPVDPPPDSTGWVELGHGT